MLKQFPNCYLSLTEQYSRLTVIRLHFATTKFKRHHHRMMRQTAPAQAQNSKGKPIQNPLPLGDNKLFYYDNYFDCCHGWLFSSLVFESPVIWQTAKSKQIRSVLHCCTLPSVDISLCLQLGVCTVWNTLFFPIRTSLPLYVVCLCTSTFNWNYTVSPSLFFSLSPHETKMSTSLPSSSSYWASNVYCCHYILSLWSGLRTPFTQHTNTEVLYPSSA